MPDMEKLPDTPAALGRLLSISTPYASQILSGNRPWTRALALSVYRKTGERVGPLIDASDSEIEVLARFEQDAAA